MQIFTKNCNDFESLIFVETKCPMGHIQLYRQQIKEAIQNIKIILITTQEYAENFIDLDIAIHVIQRSHFKNTGAFIYRLQQLEMLFFVHKALKELPDSKVIFLSYDTIAFSIMSYILSQRNIYIVDHNNIDQNKNSFVKRMFFRAIHQKATHLCFENYICDFLQTSYGIKAVKISHPERKISISSVGSNAECPAGPYVFCPSSECEPNFLQSLLVFCKREQLLLVTKPHPHLPTDPMVIVQEYFTNYDALFLKATFIAIGADFQYRVSGVCYEALANDKDIIFHDCLFSRAIAKKSINTSIFLTDEGFVAPDTSIVSG